MRIFNEAKTEELQNPDLTLGHLEPDTLITHIEAIEAVEEQSHIEVVAEYPNGGKDVERVIDVEGVEAVPAHDVTEDIQVYIPYTQDELIARELRAEKVEKKQWLKDHDYIGVKIATGRATIEEYAEDIATMTEYANRINEINDILV